VTSYSKQKSALLSKRSSKAKKSPVLYLSAISSGVILSLLCNDGARTRIGHSTEQILIGGMP
jgi:hypothetical protein